MKYVIYKGANNNVRYQKVMLLDIRNRQVEEDLTEVILQDTETKKLILDTTISYLVLFYYKYSIYQ